MKISQKRSLSANRLAVDAVAVCNDAITFELCIFRENAFFKALKCKPSAEFGGNIAIFGLKTPLYAYVLDEHTSMKNEL